MLVIKAKSQSFPSSIQWIEMLVIQTEAQISRPVYSVLKYWSFRPKHKFPVQYTVYWNAGHSDRSTNFPSSIQCIVFRLHVYGLLKESKRHYNTKEMFVKLEGAWQKQHTKTCWIITVQLETHLKT